MPLPEIIRLKKATDRAQKGFASLGVMPENVDRRRVLSERVEQFLWKFLRLRWSDIHMFFASVEPKEAMELSHETFKPGLVYEFFSDRQNESEFEDTLTVGVTLLFAAMHQAERRGFNPNTAGLFTLERMLEQAIEPVQDLEELLLLGRPATP
jgi:hypothetical protein